MNEMFKPVATSPADITALRTRDAGELYDIAALGRLASVQRMLSNSLTIANLDPGNHLLGTMIDWGAGQREVNIVPHGQQTIENFQFMTIWFRQIQADPPLRLTNNANYACFYEVNKLLGNGQTQQMQIVNPWPGSSSAYELDVGQRLIVVPVGMARYVLAHDPALKCVVPPKR